MFQTCVFDQKLKERKQCYIPKTFSNAMIGKIKIKNMFDIIKVSKSIQPNKCTHQKKIMKIPIEVFAIFF